MIYEGKAITVKPLEGGIVELNFDLKGESVNKFNRLILSELRAAVDAIKADASVKGVIVTSGSRDYDFVSRFFAPGSGIDEDPVTGSAHCCLTPYWSAKRSARNTASQPLAPSPTRVAMAAPLLPLRSTLVAPGFFEP